MHRIDGAGHDNNTFTEGDPQASVPATVVTDDWLNAVQEEIANVIEEGGGELDKQDNTQLLTKIQALIAAGQSIGVPTGTTINGYFAAAPTGFVEASGVTLSRATYSDLYDHAVAEGLVITEAAWQAGEYGMFSDGDGATTFRIPDLRGEFLRGWDHGRGVDSGRALGSWQDSENKAHIHGVPFDNTGGTGSGSGNLEETGTPSDPGAIDTTSSGGAESRPRNIALMVCIKY
ncbi:MAG: hypothetical protein OQL08_08810 [Gammaproteobacteria bacterium]|nr:hypothetical protein [Gammaproteobacteria bacterium]